jgi:TfoX/Sxy family transcriptional regulator of competence genes
MAYDESSAQRLRALLSRRKGISEKHMFGGVGFLLNGNMCVGVWKEFLIVRVGPDAYRTSLQQPSTREFDITGRAMRGWVMVEPDGFASAEQLKLWVAQAWDFVKSLPAK